MSGPGDPVDPGEADREPAGPEGPGDGSRTRLLRALGHPSRSQVLGGLLVGVLGFATVTQVQSTQRDDSYAGLRSADLVQVLNGLNAQSRRADVEIQSLEQRRRALTDRSQRRAAALAQAREQSDTLGILAGTLPTHGPGIRIRVSDPEDRISLNNLLDGVEELRAAGAEAMEFNGKVRVVAQTSFEDAQSGLVIDGEPVRAPYVIDVIGDPDTMATTLDFAEGFSYDVRASGGSVDVEKLDDVRITATVPKPDPQYAENSS